MKNRGRRNDRNDNYVYIFLDPRKVGRWSFSWGSQERIFEFQPFYVGRGIDERITDHLIPSLLSKSSHKNNTIKSILSDIFGPVLYKVFESLTYDDSVKIETSMIAHFGRACEGGILTNLIEGEWAGKKVGEEVKIAISQALTEKIVPRSKRVNQKTLDGFLIASFDSITIAGNTTKISRIGISRSCHGKIQNYGGFIWEFDGTSSYQAPRTAAKGGKVVFQYSSSGDFIERFDSIQEASEKLNISLAQINVCAGGLKRRFFVGGFRWFFDYQGEKIESKNPNSSQHVKIAGYNDEGDLVKEYPTFSSFAASEISGFVNRYLLINSLGLGIKINDILYKSIG
jgi:hypothetical protein